MALKAERHIVARLFAKATTKLGLATTIAALCLTAVPSQARLLTVKSARHARRPFSNATAWPNDIRYTSGVTPKSICIGPAWPDMANKNNWQSASQMGMRFARLRNIVVEERYARAPRYRDYQD